MANAKTYDEIRSANLQENRRMLQELGVRMPRNDEKVMLNKPKLPPRQPKQRIPVNLSDPDHEEDDEENRPDELGRSSSRSFRVRLKPKYYQDEVDCVFDPPKPKARVQRPSPSYGKVPGVEVGREWKTRMECSEDLIHRPTVAGIHGGPDGAFSVALSGGYEDDVDFGESFTYTGEGGRDLKGTKDKPKNLRTAPQSKDQSLDRGNLALARSAETQNPVRVVRGYKLDSQYAPEEGYRYDGLYLVKKYWAARGKSGFKVWKFALIRCDSEPAPWVQLPVGNLGSPTSPTTPASIPQTGVEAFEAPSLDADDCEDYLQLEEAQIEAKQPDDRKGVKKKVSFNFKDDIKFFETESFEEEKPEEPGRVTTRSSSAKALEKDAGNVPNNDDKPAQLRKRSQRTVKPTTKVLENFCLEDDKGPPKLVVSASPVVSITEMSLSSIPNLGEDFKKTNDNKDGEPPKKRSLRERNEDKKSPTMDKCSPMASDLETKGEKKAGRHSTTPEKRPNKSPQLSKPRKSPESEKSRKDGLSPSVREKPKASKCLTNEIPRRRSVSPEYPATQEKLKPCEYSTDEVPRKRSISPEYPATHEKPRSLKSSTDQVKRSVSPDYPEKSKSSGSLSNESSRKRSISPEYLPEDELGEKKLSERRGKPAVSSPLTPADEKKEKRLRGRPKKLSASPQRASSYEKTKKSPKSFLDDNRPKHGPTDKKLNQSLKSSPKSSLEVKLRERSVSPEYLPEDDKCEDRSDHFAPNKTAKESVSPNHLQKSSLSDISLKKSAKSRDTSSRDASKNRSSSPANRSKNLDRQSKSSTSSLEEKPQWNSKSPSGKATQKSPKSAEVSPKEIRADKSKMSPGGSKGFSPKSGVTRGQSPNESNLLSKESARVSNKTKSPKLSVMLENEANFKESVESYSPEKSTERLGKSLEKTQSSQEKTKQADSKESKARKRLSSISDEESGDVGVPMKKPRANSSKSSCEIPTEVKSEEERNDDVEEEKVADDDLSSEFMDDAPMSTESMEDEAPTECEREDPPNLIVATDPETKKREKETFDTLTPPETETCKSNSPTPNPPISVSSPSSSMSASRASVNDKPCNILDYDEFPSDEEILNMMQFSLGACTSDGPKIVVKMVNGKWIEMEKNDTASDALR